MFQTKDVNIWRRISQLFLDSGQFGAIVCVGRVVFFVAGLYGEMVNNELSKLYRSTTRRAYNFNFTH